MDIINIFINFLFNVLLLHESINSCIATINRIVLINSITNQADKLKCFQKSFTITIFFKKGTSPNNANPIDPMNNDKI